MSTCPEGGSCTVTRFARICPGCSTLMFDTSAGTLPVGTTFTQPGPAGFVAVTFRTAARALAGTPP